MLKKLRTMGLLFVLLVGLAGSSQMQAKQGAGFNKETAKKVALLSATYSSFALDAFSVGTLLSLVFPTKPVNLPRGLRYLFSTAFLSGALFDAFTLFQIFINSPWQYVGAFKPLLVKFGLAAAKVYVGLALLKNKKKRKKAKCEIGTIKKDSQKADCAKEVALVTG